MIAAATTRRMIASVTTTETDTSAARHTTLATTDAQIAAIDAATVRKNIAARPIDHTNASDAVAGSGICATSSATIRMSRKIETPSTRSIAKRRAAAM